jgi:hypothetical protein
MSIRSGLASQIGIAAETTFGSPVTADHFIEFNKESINFTVDRMESKGLRASNRVLRSDRWVAGKKAVAGDVEAEIQTKGFGLLLKSALGGSTITTPSGATLARLHRYILADPYGQSYTLQVGRPDTSGTVNPFTYSGMKVSEFDLKNSLDGFVTGTWKWTGQTEAMQSGTSPYNAAPYTLASSSYAASTEILSWIGGTLNIAGSAVAVVTDFSLNVKTGIKSDRYTINSSRLIKEQIIADMTEITGQVSVEFSDLTAYQRFTAGTLAQIDVTWSGETVIESTTYPYLKVTMPKCRFDGNTPNVDGPGVLKVDLPFKALYDGTNEAITMDYLTSDTTD